MEKSPLLLAILLFSLVVGSIGFVNPVNALVEEGVTTNPIPPGYGFIDFEEGVDGEVVASTVPGVSFTTTMGLDWIYADIRTGSYNARSLTDPSVNYGNYVVNGYFCAWLGVSGDQGRIDFTEGPASYFSALFSTNSGVTVDAYDSDDNLIATSGWADGNYGTYTFTRCTIEAPGIAYVIVHDTGNYWEIDDIVTDAPGVPREGLEDALREINELQIHLLVLYDEELIDDYKLNRMWHSLDLAYNLTANAMWYLDNERLGFDDLKEGMSSLYHAVAELEGLVDVIQSWVEQGYMAGELTEGIVEELVRIQLKLVNKAAEEAESEIMLAIDALEDAEARGKYVPWLWGQVEQAIMSFEDGEDWLDEGWLSKAIHYYKTAFWRAQYVVNRAYDWRWDIDIKDWIDLLEQDQ